ncbi:MAG: transglutaminase domain-containing protein [Geminicoccaceae bacterium]
MRTSLPYSEHTPWSEPGRFAELVSTWPLDPAGLSEAIAERLVHIRSDEGKGHVDQDCLRQDLPLRSAPELLAASKECRRDGGPSKVGAVCRDFALLAVSAFRSRGFPARLRVGFADYFTKGFFEDHWLCEWRDGDRWRRLDVEVAAGAAPSRIPFDPTDVAHDRFGTAAETWATTRRRPEDAERYGVSALDLAGRWFIAGSVYRDAAALSCVEVKPWDYWGLGLSLAIDRVKVGVEVERDVDKLSSILERSDVDNVSSSLPPVQEWMPEKTVNDWSQGTPRIVTLRS